MRRVIIDTPALLNMVKHCREQSTVDQVGILMGITQKDELNGDEDSLLITQTMPRANKSQMNDLLNKLEQDSQKLIDTNEVGFYVSSRIGLSFNRDVIVQYIEAYKKFKNAIFIVYDISKSDYGMDPLKAYRLSEKALQTLTVDGSL